MEDPCCDLIGAKTLLALLRRIRRAKAIIKALKEPFLLKNCEHVWSNVICKLIVEKVVIAHRSETDLLSLQLISNTYPSGVKLIDQVNL